MPQGKRILLATVMGGYAHGRTLDLALYQALGLRGAEVEILLCDKGIPCCQMIKIGRAPPEGLAAGQPIAYCDKCVTQGKDAYEPLDAAIHWIGGNVSAEERTAAVETARSVPMDDIRQFLFGGIHVGEHAYAGALRYFARGDLGGEPFAEAVLRRYLEAGILSSVALRNLLRRERFDILVINHGIYVAQGIFAEVARAEGLRVVTYNPAYRKHSFIFSHTESYHHTMLSEPTETWRTLPMTPALEAETRAYLESRRTGANDWIWFHNDPVEDAAPFLRALGADPDAPYVTALTSVLWDAQLHYRDNAFDNLLDWLFKTVEHWGSRSDGLQLVVRVHPAEVSGMVPSRQLVADELATRFPELPRNVFVIPPDNRCSTYALCDKADAVIVYNTKTGIEVSATGIPVIVAGEAWVRGKGFTRDASHPDDYFRILDALPFGRRLSPEERGLAMRYAYHFFFRRMIPLPFIEQSEGARFALNIDGPEDLAPGRWPGLDVICDGILTGAPFVYPAERISEAMPLRSAQGGR